MKQIEGNGFPDETKAKSNFEQKELMLEKMGKALSDLDGGYSQEIEALKETVKLLKERIKAGTDFVLLPEVAT